MSTITESVEVGVPVTDAYNQWTQFETFPRFMEGVEQVRQLDDTHVHWVTKVGGVTREFDATIVEQIPDQCVSWRSDAGPDHAGKVTFDKVDARTTRVTAKMNIDPEGFVENVADKLGVLDRRVKGDLKRFKEFIEERGGRETGAWRGSVESTTEQSTAQGSSTQAGKPGAGIRPGGPGVSGLLPDDPDTGGLSPKTDPRPPL
ncbi:SRPBCC family protein [Actinokineospora sp. HBU206404]|uniref:SRPBCC family protein n=1 Tax=Actinokineospora xionganensis TaxID=2684470 RepID=A0ABR7LF07_9PSEU|nr:SRPBCC family protein [Actinokineospora xionganensis]